MKSNSVHNLRSFVGGRSHPPAASWSFCPPTWRYSDNSTLCVCVCVYIYIYICVCLSVIFYMLVCICLCVRVFLWLCHFVCDPRTLFSYLYIYVQLSSSLKFKSWVCLQKYWKYQLYMDFCLKSSKPRKGKKVSGESTEVLMGSHWDPKKKFH